MHGTLRRLLRPRARLRELHFRRLYRKYQDATMIQPRSFVANLRVADAALRNQQDQTAAIIECGTWRGGMSAALIELGGPGREYHFFDSFAGLPKPTDLDGERGKHWGKGSEFYFDNCAASLDEFQHTITMANPPTGRTHTHKGWFEQTIPPFSAPPIAVLRLDGDLYDSTMVCLTHLWDHVIDGGLVLIDDYYWWDGCRRAVHDFLSKRDLPVPIQQAAEQLAYLIKPISPTSP